MAEVDTNLLADLQARGLVAQMTGDDALEAYLKEGPRTLYCGFDPTADSLHIGSLVPLLTLKRFQLLARFASTERHEFYCFHIYIAIFRKRERCLRFQHSGDLI